jgi:predicted metal-dependent phosphoesterase TrpH
MLLKVELHTHTSDDPQDLVPHSAIELIDRAAALGYHALAITLHDKQLDIEPLRAHASARGVVLIPGVERTLEGRHVLLLNFSARAEELAGFEELAELKQRECGLVIAPHPFYPLPNCLGDVMDRHGALIDAVEVNAFYVRAVDFNGKAIRWAGRNQKPLVGNGDVHRLAQLGTTYSLVDAAPDPQSICDAIRAGRVTVQTEPLSALRAALIFADLLAAWLRTFVRRPATALAWCLAAMLVSGIAACGSGGTPAQPTPVTPAPNTPPMIQSITTSSPRIEADDQIQVSATVTDAETPVDQLSYQWSATPVNGTFIGGGAQLSWQAPHMQATPDLYTLALTVVEHYTVNGLPAQNTASSSVTVHYNDSNAEITGLSLQFLKDFTTFSVSPEQCVRNFSDTCPGKADELSDITANRQFFHISGGTYSVSRITFNADRTFANILAPCTFFDTVNATGKAETVPGNCLLTALYENWRWSLCDSHFQGTGPTTTGLAQFMGPGSGR